MKNLLPIKTNVPAKFPLRSLLVLCCVWLMCTAAFAQSRTVTGKVTDQADGSGIPGVNVVVEGTSNGTVTDYQGNYTLQADDNATLVFSFVGYENQEVNIGAKSVVAVALCSSTVVVEGATKH